MFQKYVFGVASLFLALFFTALAVAACTTCGPIGR